MGNLELGMGILELSLTSFTSTLSVKMLTQEFILYYIPRLQTISVIIITCTGVNLYRHLARWEQVDRVQ